MPVLFLHLFISTFVSFVYPIKGESRGERSPKWVRFMTSFKVDFKLTIFISTLLQFLFVGLSFWIATSWFLSIAPLVNDSSLSLVPDFIWPNTSQLLRNWIVPINITELTSNLTILAECQSNNESSFYCLRDFVGVLYLFFVICCCTLVLYHQVLILSWPRINQLAFDGTYDV